MTCTFFGHRDTPMSASEKLKGVLIDLIESGADTFLVGTEGGFDGMVYAALCELKGAYPHISVSRVLAYLPTKADSLGDSTGDSIYPEGLETVPKRFAIARRNEWLVKQADTVVCYIERQFGGAAKYTEYARKKGKRIINLAE